MQCAATPPAIRTTGEPDALKGARPAREGGAGKGPATIPRPTPYLTRIALQGSSVTVGATLLGTPISRGKNLGPLEKDVCDNAIHCPRCTRERAAPFGGWTMRNERIEGDEWTTCHGL